MRVLVGALAVCIFGAGLAAPAAAQMVSVYTKIGQKHCTVVKKAAPGDGEWAITRCGGYGGWRVYVDYDDAREFVRLVRPGVNLKLHHGVSTFSFVGPVLEWRARRGGPPSAAIFRVRWKDLESKRNLSRLVVAKIGGGAGCVVAYVESSAPNMNRRARQIADTVAPTFACGTKPVIRVR